MIRSERNLETKSMGIFRICRYQKIVNRWIIFGIMIILIVFDEFTIKCVNVYRSFSNLVHIIFYYRYVLVLKISFVTFMVYELWLVKHGNFCKDRKITSPVECSGPMLLSLQVQSLWCIVTKWQKDFRMACHLVFFSTDFNKMWWLSSLLVNILLETTLYSQKE